MQMGRRVADAPAGVSRFNRLDSSAQRRFWRSTKLQGMEAEGSRMTSPYQQAHNQARRMAPAVPTESAAVQTEPDACPVEGAPGKPPVLDADTTYHEAYNTSDTYLWARQLAKRKNAAYNASRRRPDQPLRPCKMCSRPFSPKGPQHDYCRQACGRLAKQQRARSNP